MGQRSSSETVVAILQSFLTQRTWSQAELARALNVGVRTLRQRLTELEHMGVPFHVEDDHPHVYWSVPPDWIPGGIAFDRGDVIELLRLLRRIPASRGRDALLAKITRATRAAVAAPATALRLDPTEETQLPVVEDAHGERRALTFTYFSASRGHMEERSASVHAVLHGPPARFVATCHRDGKLKWFRVDRIFHARMDGTFRPAAPADVDAFLAHSVSGFNGADPPSLCAFVVRDPEARWVQRNLPSPMTATPVPGGLRVTVTTGAIGQVARFVVGLGAAATAETPALADLVRALAEGALAANR